MVLFFFSDASCNCVQANAKRILFDDLSKFCHKFFGKNLALLIEKRWEKSKKVLIFIGKD